MEECSPESFVVSERRVCRTCGVPSNKVYKQNWVFLNGISGLVSGVDKCRHSLIDHGENPIEDLTRDIRFE
jgi:hypothetical protein